MWQTDTVTIQTGSEVNYLGSIKVIWADSSIVTCDVQEIHKEKVFKEYGFTDVGDYKQVFDYNLATNWVEGNQVKYNNQQYWVKLVNGNMGKMGLSNHVYVILSRVIGSEVSVVLPWILVGGIWNDNGVWIDAETWID